MHFGAFGTITKKSESMSGNRLKNGLKSQKTKQTEFTSVRKLSGKFQSFCG